MLVFLPQAYGVGGQSYPNFLASTVVLETCRCLFIVFKRESDRVACFISRYFLSRRASGSSGSGWPLSKTEVPGGLRAPSAEEDSVRQRGRSPELRR